MDTLVKVIGCVALLSGLVMMAFPQWLQARVDARRDALAKGESERYFEERRAMATYPPPATGGDWRRKGFRFAL